MNIRHPTCTVYALQLKSFCAERSKALLICAVGLMRLIFFMRLGFSDLTFFLRCTRVYRNRERQEQYACVQLCALWKSENLHFRNEKPVFLKVFPFAVSSIIYFVLRSLSRYFVNFDTFFTRDFFYAVRLHRIKQTLFNMLRKIFCYSYLWSIWICCVAVSFPAVLVCRTEASLPVYKYTCIFWVDIFNAEQRMSSMLYVSYL